MTPVLLDASAMVALFDDAEASHAHFASHIERLARGGRALVTTWSCVTEASCLLSPRNHCALLRWLGHGGAQVRHLQAADLPQLLRWMEAYSEAGKALMDLADASLMWLAETEQTAAILTADHRDFLRYRLPGGSAFEVL